MATWTEKDLVKAVKDAGEVVVSQGDWIIGFMDRLNSMMSLANQLLVNIANISQNPMLKKIIEDRVNKRMMFMPSGLPQPQATDQQAEAIYTAIVQALDGFSKQFGDMTLSEASEFLKKSKNLAVKTIKDYIEKQGQQVTQVNADGNKPT